LADIDTTRRGCSAGASGWIKVKTEKWKAANRWRGEFFEKSAPD
jgi:hypothetical protein